jgi:hypothetical protein
MLLHQTVLMQKGRIVNDFFSDGTGSISITMALKFLMPLKSYRQVIIYYYLSDMVYSV